MMALFCFIVIISSRFTLRYSHHAKHAWTQTVQWKEPINFIKSLCPPPSELTTHKHQNKRTHACTQ